MGEPPTVDLARLAAAYAHRGEKGGARRARMAAAASGLGVGGVAVDVGGGRGVHAAEFRAMGARAVVVDPSVDMALAARRLGVPAAVGMGERLPLGDGVAALVYFHLSIHHGASTAMLAEARRVAAPGGTVWVWTLAAEHHRSSFLARWFPSVAEIDERRFPAPETIAEGLRARGVAGVTIGAMRQRVERRAGSWEEAVRSGFVSTLHLVDPGEIDAGLERFRAAHPDPGEVLVYDLDYRSIHGTVPGLVS